MLIRPDMQIESVACDICRNDNPIILFLENGFPLNRCGHCGHFYVSPRPGYGSVNGMEGDDKPTAEIQVADEMRRKPIFERYVGYVKRYVQKGKWLDIGCGCGTLLRVAEGAGFEAEGIEVDPERLTLCRKAGLSVFEREIESNFLPRSSYDVISLINVFSHLRSPVATFSSIHRILRPNGIIIVATSELGKEAHKDEVKKWNIPDHLHFAGPQTFRLIAASLNLGVFYASRLLTQKVVISEKLGYRSERALVEAGKAFLRHFPGTKELMARAICLTRGYYHPRHEVVVFFHRAI